MAEIRSVEEFLKLKQEGFYTPKEVAAVLDCSVSLVYKLIYEGKLPSYLLSGRRIIFKRDLDRFIKEQLKDGMLEEP